MNFKILTVNGQDLSGVSHEEAAGTLESALQPITVVLTRSGSKKDTPDEAKSARHPKEEKKLPNKISVSTQTQSELCFCRFLLENVQDISSPFSDFVRNEIIRYRDRYAELVLRGINDEDSYEDNIPIEDEYYHVAYEEVTLNRPSDGEKLGLMLCDHKDEYSNQTKVIVSEVASESIAARCEKIFPGDQILKIDDEPVNCMNDASRLLNKDTQSISFHIGHPQIMEETSWAAEDGTHFDNSFRSDNITCDVRNCVKSPVNNVTSNQMWSTFLADARQNNCAKYTEEMQCDGSAAKERRSFNGSTGSSNQTGKDSGIEYTLESSVQSTFENCTRRTSLDAQTFPPMFSEGSKKFSSLRREFVHVQPKNHLFMKKASSQQQKTTTADSAKCSMDASVVDKNSTTFQDIKNVVQNTKLKNNEKSLEDFLTSSIEVYAERTIEAVSPWVKIARQDYEEKMRQFQNSEDLRYIHPALTSNDIGNLDTIMTSMSLSCTPSDAADNTSSAYSTGESLRSSSTTSAPRLSNETSSPPLSPVHTHKKNPLSRTGVTMTYYMSSDANSDDEGPACYLTHAEDSESEGFEDAGLEFNSTFHSAPNQSYRPVPLPRLLHPPCEATNFMSHSLTASTKQLWKASAAVAQNRRQAQTEGKAVQLNEQKHLMNGEESTDNRCVQESILSLKSVNVSNKTKSKADTVAASDHKNSGRESNASAAIETDCQTNQCSASDPDVYETKPIQCGDGNGPKVRRSSEHVRPSKKLIKTQRSFSCIEPPNFEKQQNNETGDESKANVQMEWKVRVSKDGTRYITKRPVREKVLRHREKRLLAERCGVTTDDDVTELKLGRHWTRDDRKRHLRHAREKKRRRDFMQRCRLEVLNENSPADGEIVELSHKKMSKQKHKRMLLDNFVTVQEILAHGDRSNGVAKVSPLVSVTYI